MKQQPSHDRCNIFSSSEESKFESDEEWKNQREKVRYLNDYLFNLGKVKLC